MVDVTSGSEQSVDNSLFNDVFSAVFSEIRIVEMTNSNVGAYTLRLKLSYVDYPAVSTYRDFIIEIAKDCGQMSIN